MPLDEAVLDFVLPDDDLAAIRSQYGPVEQPPRGDAIEDVIKSGRETLSTGQEKDPSTAISGVEGNSLHQQAGAERSAEMSARSRTTIANL